MDSLLEEMKARQKMQEQKKEILKQESQARAAAEVGGPAPNGAFGASALAGGGFGGAGFGGGKASGGGSGGAATAAQPLFLRELGASTTEDTLCQLFSRYGTVVSVVIAHEGQKIQGYVTLDARENAQRAKDALQDREVDGVPLWIEWCAGPPPTPSPGAEPRDGRHVVVEAPPDQRRRRIIDRLAKYVAQEGHSFEQLVMEREAPDGSLAFLFQQGSKENIYYRWRAFAFAQGDNFKIWRTETFRICEGGAWWQPPPCEGPLSNKRNTNFSSAPAAAKALAKHDPKDGAAAAPPAERPVAAAAKGPRPGWAPEDEEEERQRLRLEERATQERQRRDRDKKGLAGGKRLSDTDWDLLEQLLRSVSGARCTVLEGMAFCLDHADMAIEIAECITQALTILETEMTLKISRLLIVSDILHNTASSRPSAWAYRREFEKSLPDIMEHFNIAIARADSKLQAEKTKEQVMRILRVWEDWGLFAPSFIRGLEASVAVGVKRLRFLATRGDSSREPTWLLPKLTDWRKQHFSQLEKMCRTRGLRFSTSHLEASRELPLEDTRKEWLIDRLAAYELHWHEKEQARLAAGAGSGGAGSARAPAAGRGSDELDGEAMECDIDGFPLDETELDGLRLEFDDWADVLQMHEAAAASHQGGGLGGGATMVYGEAASRLQGSLDSGAAAGDEAVGELLAPGADQAAAAAQAAEPVPETAPRPPGDDEDELLDVPQPAEPARTEEPTAAQPGDRGGAAGGVAGGAVPAETPSKMSRQDVELEVMELRASLVMQGLHQDAIEDICEEKRQRLVDEIEGTMASPPPLRSESRGGGESSDNQQEEDDDRAKETKPPTPKQVTKEPEKEKDRDKDKKSKEDRTKDKDREADREKEKPKDKEGKSKKEKEKHKDKHKKEEKERARQQSRSCSASRIAAAMAAASTKDKGRKSKAANDDRDKGKARSRSKDKERGKKEKHKARDPSRSRSRSREQRGKKSRR